MKTTRNRLFNHKLVISLSAVALVFGLGLAGPESALGQFSSTITITGNATPAGTVTFELVDASTNAVVQTTTNAVAMGDAPSVTSASVAAGLMNVGVVTTASDTIGGLLIVSTVKLRCLVCVGAGPCAIGADLILSPFTRTRLGQVWSKDVITPTVSEWGVAVMALLVLLGGTIVVRRQRKVAAA